MELTYREKGIKALGLCMDESFVETFEKAIHKQAEKDNGDNSELEKNYIWYIYQACGFLKRNKLKSGMTEIKSGHLGWKATCYDDISKRLEEADQYLLKPFDIAEGVVECLKCHSKKTWSVQKQTRSSDEPMTTFSKCVECGNEWSYSG